MQQSMAEPQELPKGHSMACKPATKASNETDMHLQRQELELDNELQDADTDGGWGWFVMIGCLLAHISIAGIGRCSGVFYIQVKDYYGQSDLLTSLSVSLGYSLTYLLGPVASALCNKFTIRTVVVLGATLCTVGGLLSAFSPNIVCFIVGFGLIIGIGRALAFGPSVVILGQYFNKRRSMALGIATSGSPVSGLVFPPMFMVLFNYYGFPGTFLIMTGISSHLYISSALYRPPEKHPRDRFKQKLRETTRIKQENKFDLHEPVRKLKEQYNRHQVLPEHHKDDDSRITSIPRRGYLRFQQIIFRLTRGGIDTVLNLIDRSLLKNFSFLCVCIQNFLHEVNLTITLIYLPALVLERGMTKMQGTYLLSVFAIGDGLSRSLWSICLDLKQVRPYRLIVYNGYIFLIALLTLCMPSTSELWLLTIVCGIYGTGFGLFVSQMSVICIDVLGIESLISSYGLLLAFDGTGIFVAPLIGGLVKDHLGTYYTTFYVGAVISLVGGTVMTAGNVWFYRRRKDGYHVFR